MNDLKFVVNKLGQVIRAGDFIAYPVRQSSSLWMSYGVVVKVVECPAGYETLELALKVISVSGPTKFDHTTCEFVRTAFKPHRRTVKNFKTAVKLDFNTLNLPEEEMVILRAATNLAVLFETK